MNFEYRQLEALDDARYDVFGPEEEDILTSLSGYDRDRFLLMSEDTESETLNDRAECIVGVCKEHGYRYSLFPHVHVPETTGRLAQDSY